MESPLVLLAVKVQPIYNFVLFLGRYKILNQEISVIQKTSGCKLKSAKIIQIKFLYKMV